MGKHAEGRKEEDPLALARMLKEVGEELPTPGEALIATYKGYFKALDEKLGAALNRGETHLHVEKGETDRFVFQSAVDMFASKGYVVVVNEQSVTIDWSVSPVKKE